MVGLLVLASLAMITVYFRESPNGGLHDFQSAASSVLRPFEIAANRVARPFEDAWNWTADVFHAKSENEKLRQQVKDLRQQAIQASQAVEDRNALRRLLGSSARRPTRTSQIPPSRRRSSPTRSASSTRRW